MQLLTRAVPTLAHAGLAQRSDARRLPPLALRLLTLMLIMLAVTLAARVAGRLRASAGQPILTALLRDADDRPCESCLLGVKPGVTRIYDAAAQLGANPLLKTDEVIREYVWSGGVFDVLLGNDVYYALYEDMRADGKPINRMEFGWLPDHDSAALPPPLVGDLLLRFGMPERVTLATPGCAGGFRLLYPRGENWLIVSTNDIASLRPETPVAALVVATDAPEGGVAWRGGSRAGYERAGACE